jgi:catechol 2,3-dioxygenase-like lactoylglutathione lyase family enzyme
MTAIATATEPVANRTPEGATDVVKFHVSLNVTDLPRALAFYSTLLGVVPAKSYPNYAKFELSDPPLILSIKPQQSGKAGPLNHLGFRLRTVEAVLEVEKRLLDAGYRPARQADVRCCYAHQTKFWVVDPDETLWEVYVLHDDHPTWGEGSKLALMLPPLRAMGFGGMLRRWWARMFSARGSNCSADRAAEAARAAEQHTPPGSEGEGIRDSSR